MVREKRKVPEGQKFYHYEPQQSSKNKIISQGPIGLLIPRSTYERYANNAKENARVNLLETKKLSALKEATYKMTASWEDTAKNVLDLKKKETLSCKNTNEVQKKKYLIETTEKKKLNHVEVVNHAKEILLYRRPRIRLINRALLLSESLRELDEQIKFQASTKDIYEKLEKQNTRLVFEDVIKFNRQEQDKCEKIKYNADKHKEDIIKQIKDNQIKSNKNKELLKFTEIQDLINIRKELEELKIKEQKTELKKKEDIKKMLLGSIKDRKQYELQVKNIKKFEDQNLKIYKGLKYKTEKFVKDKKKNTQSEKVYKLEVIGRKIYKIQEKERLRIEKLERKRDDDSKEEKIIEDLKMIEENKQRKLMVHLDMKKHIDNIEEKLEKHKKKKIDLKLWETLQRYKCEEFDKEWNLRQKKIEAEKRLFYGKILKSQMKEFNAHKKKTIKEADYSIEMKEMMNKANEKILFYAEKVLKESESIRPVHPITKSIKTFKKEIEFSVPYYREEDMEMQMRNIKRNDSRRLACTKSIEKEDIFYFC